jgi:hypothetical protein
MLPACSILILRRLRAQRDARVLEQREEAEGLPKLRERFDRATTKILDARNDAIVAENERHAVELRSIHAGSEAELSKLGERP